MSNAGRIITFVVAAIVGIVVGYLTNNAALGFAVFSTIASVGSALFPAKVSQPRPAELQFQTSSYGTTIPVVYGTRKMSGNCLWYGNFKSKKQKSGGKGGGGKTTGYKYSVSLAWGICMNTANANGDYAGLEITGIWSGKNKLNLANMILADDIRIYNGLQTEPDSHMASFLERAPVYKGLVWVVLPNFDLGSSPYIPNLTFEVGGTLAIDTITSYRTHFLTSDPIVDEESSTTEEAIIIVGGLIDSSTYRVTRINTDYSTVWTTVINRPTYADGPLIIVDNNHVFIGWSGPPAGLTILSALTGLSVFEDNDWPYETVGEYEMANGFITDMSHMYFTDSLNDFWQMAIDGSYTDLGNPPDYLPEEEGPYSDTETYIDTYPWFDEGPPITYQPAYSDAAGAISWYEDTSFARYTARTIQGRSIYLPTTWNLTKDMEHRVLRMGETYPLDTTSFLFRIIDGVPVITVFEQHWYE